MTWPLVGGVTLEQLEGWLGIREHERLEFKEAQSSFSFDRLVKYCCALANERGGRLVLGVTDQAPRSVVGTNAFREPERTKTGIVERLHLRVDLDEISHPDGRVLVFTVPSRPIGVPIQFEGAYWMRSGESLVPMTQDQLRRIFDETMPDFSAVVCAGATMADLDPNAVEEFRRRWISKSGNSSLANLSQEQLLGDAELIEDGGVTYAALVLVGSRRGLGRHLAQAEVVFEYRSSDASIPYQERQEYREGLFGFHDRLWNDIDKRNDIQTFQDGFFRHEVRTFNEQAVREAILNAVSHRDLQRRESVFVRQFPRRLEVASPGGFLPGITPQNILFKQAPRNRRLAEALFKCGLIERSGQGADLMLKTSIREGKPRPDYFGTDDYEVVLTLRGEVQDTQFLRFLEKVGSERLERFSVQDLLVLDAVASEQSIPDDLRARVPALVEAGIIERIGRGKGTRHILSRALYDFIGRKGAYTRAVGLDRETNKALLLKHIQDNSGAGSQLGELMEVLPSLSRDQVQRLLRQLRTEGRAHNRRRTRSARWYPGSGPDAGGL